MNFDPNDYVSPSEVVILSETVNIRPPNFATFVKHILTLTSKKIIAVSGNTHLHIIPLNKIREIRGYYYQFFIHCAGDSHNGQVMAIDIADNPSSYCKIVQEIAKRIG